MDGSRSKGVLCTTRSLIFFITFIVRVVPELQPKPNNMKATVVDFAKDRVIYNITGCTKDELDNKLNLFFTSEGYKLKKAEGEIRMYEKGNRILRILFGAFVKYHKQSVTVRNEGELYSLLLNKESSGMSGGLIGMNQVKKEFARLTEAFKVYFAN